MIYTFDTLTLVLKSLSGDQSATILAETSNKLCKLYFGVVLYMVP